MTIAIKTSHLTKKFKQSKINYKNLRSPISRKWITALNDINLQINTGELLCLLGKNGAGKSTLIRTLCGLITPTCGKAFIFGNDIGAGQQAIKKYIGYIICDERSFYWRLSGRQNLNFFAALYKLPREKMHNRIDELLEFFDLQRDADRPFKSYSSGMKQKLAIARGMLHNPDILFLDEPIKSLDPTTSLKIQQFIKQTIVKEHGKTVFLTTHNLEEAQFLNDKIAIIENGKIEASGTLEKIAKSLHLNSYYEIKLKNRIEEIEHKLLPIKYKIIKQTTAINPLTKLAVPCDESEIDTIINHITFNGGKILSCNKNKVTVADIYHSIVTEDQP